MTGATPAAIASKAGCTGLSQGDVASAVQVTGAEAGGICMLGSQSVGVLTFKSAADVQNGILGAAALGGSDLKIYLVVGPNWIATDAENPTQAAAEKIAASFGGTVKLAQT